MFVNNDDLPCIMAVSYVYKRCVWHAVPRLHACYSMTHIQTYSILIQRINIHSCMHYLLLHIVVCLYFVDAALLCVCLLWLHCSFFVSWLDDLIYWPFIIYCLYLYVYEYLFPHYSKSIAMAFINHMLDNHDVSNANTFHSISLGLLREVQCIHHTCNHVHLQ